MRERTAERGVRFVEDSLRFGKRLGKLASHADFLRTLSWKDKRDHESSH
jgi:hypothetical protein